uniref:Photosynthetic NDH subcomplex L 2 n=1 Tax=California macrophylla TaxID=337344 RepID=A0A0F7GY81_9ROSI
MGSSVAAATVLLRVRAEATTHHKNPTHLKIQTSAPKQNLIDRRKLVITTFVTTSLGLALLRPQPSLAENWGTHSFLWERFFQPGLSPEDAVARIRQTAEGLHSLREMVDKMAWRYIIFYIRLKQSYLGQDLKTAMSTLPESRRTEYVETANELVHNMSKLDDFIRTPKVYESYLYYEETLKSMDKVVALL